MSPWVGSLLWYLSLFVHVIVIFFFVLLEQRRPATTLAWIIALIFLPYVGLGLYFLIGTPRLYRQVRRRSKAAVRLRQMLAPYDPRGRKRRVDATAAHDVRTLALLELGRRLETSGASTGNTTEILEDGAATYAAIANAITAARNHIHVEFYIVRPDATGMALRDLLATRAAAGIEVRMLVDAVGSGGLPGGFWAPLLAAGGKVAVFSPVTALARLRRPHRVDFRTHRKIVVVDGVEGFTGGINVGREYLGLSTELGRWRDTHLRIRGPAVLALQQAFAEHWVVASGEPCDAARYYPDPGTPAGTELVQIVDSGPDRRWSAIHHLYYQAIALAQRRVWLTTPYFVPDEMLEGVLVGAALRGVDVRLLLPRRSDAWLVSLAARSYYADLLAAGVHLFEYGGGTLHAKTMVVDEWMGTIGSANLDIRSFYLNHELNAFVYGSDFANAMAKMFAADLGNAQPVRAEDVARTSMPRRWCQNTARLLSPLL